MSLRIFNIQAASEKFVLMVLKRAGESFGIFKVSEIFVLKVALFHTVVVGRDHNSWRNIALLPNEAIMAGIGHSVS